MNDRRHLRHALTKAWRHVIETAYVDRIINSERSLQAHFAAEILQEFSIRGMKRSVLIEPRLVFSDKTWKIPDIIICNRDKVVAVIELKYVPRGTPSPDKDISTLVRVCKEQGALTLENPRYWGPTKPKAYTIAADAVMSWAVVCKQSPIKLPPRNEKILGDRLLYLQAITSSAANPKYFPKSLESGC